MSSISFSPNMSVQYVTPTTGQTITMQNNLGALLINPAGSLLTLTITVPATPFNGQKIEIGSTQAITALTMNGGTIANPLASLLLGGFGQFVYNGATSSWFRTG